MMSGSRIGDLAVKVGTYESQGQTKNRYQKIGNLFQSERGLYARLDTLFLSTQLLERCRDENGAVPDSIVVSVFDEREGGRGGGGDAPRRGGPGARRGASAPPAPASAGPVQENAFEDDEIPF
jgi:hypothetical protein